MLLLFAVITFLHDINEAVAQNNMPDVIDCLQVFSCTLDEAHYDDCYHALRQLQKRKVKVFIEITRNVQCSS